MKKLKWFVVVVLLGSFACDPNEPPTPLDPNQEVKKAIFDTMKEWYFWNQELPSEVDFADLASLSLQKFDCRFSCDEVTS